MQLKTLNPGKIQYYYATVSEAINKLRLEGYTIDLNLEGDRMVRHPGVDELEIMKVYRYEGDSDPADEATVFAIQSTGGMKGILVTGDGIYADGISTALLSKLAGTTVSRERR